MHVTLGNRIKQLSSSVVTMWVTILSLSLLLATCSVLTSAVPHSFRKIAVTHYTATANTILLRWRKRIGDARLTNFKVAYIGRRNYHDRSNGAHEIIFHGLSPAVKSEEILLENLTHCTNYSVTLSGWNDLTAITNKPMYIKTLPKAIEPIVPSIATQLRSDGHAHAVVTVHLNADNIGCKKYQLIVMLSDNFTESQQQRVSTLDEALTKLVNYVYIAVEFNDTEPISTLELGDGKYYGKYLNKPLVPSICYRVAIRIVYSKSSELSPTYSELSPDPWCLKPLIPVSGAIGGVNKSTAAKSIGIAIGTMALIIISFIIGWIIFTLCQKKGLFYSDKIIKGPLLWDVVRGKKGPTILDQLISVNYHDNDKSTYDFIDEGFDLVPSGTSIVKDVSRHQTQSEGSVDASDDKISSQGSETPIERLYDDPATDSS